MSNHSEEDYLDQLLYSMGDGSSTKKTVQEKAPVSAREEFEAELFGEPESESDRAKDEEAFLREFEAELLQDELPDDSTEFERDLFSEEEEEKQNALDQSLDEVLAGMPEQEKETVVDEDAEFEGELPEDTKEHSLFQEAPLTDSLEASETSDEASLEESVSGQLDQAMGAFDENMAAEQSEDGTVTPLEGEEIDLSGMKDQDLMDMLSADDDLSDLGELLSDQEEGKPVDGEDSIGAFAKSQMDEQQQAISQPLEEDGLEESGGKKKNKKKKEKSSLFQKLSKMFFGEEQEDTLVIPDDGMDGVMELSAENQQILKELEEADSKDSSGKGKKEKKKKEKKKQPKPKKEKKPKQPKPKKEKKPKPVDHTPPLPKGPVIAIAIMVASLLGLVLLGTSTLGYQANVNAAKEAYQEGAYVEAYQKLQGLKIRQRDEKLYNRLAVLAAVSEKYQAYLIFDSYGSRDMALDSLVCAYGRCEVNEKYAKEYECEPQLEELKGKISKALDEDFSMKEKEAEELYQIKNRDEYTIQLRKKLKDSGLD